MRRVRTYPPRKQDYETQAMEPVCCQHRDRSADLWNNRERPEGICTYVETWYAWERDDGKEKRNGSINESGTTRNPDGGKWNLIPVSHRRKINSRWIRDVMKRKAIQNVLGKGTLAVRKHLLHKTWIKNCKINLRSPIHQVKQQKDVSHKLEDIYSTINH